MKLSGRLLRIGDSRFTRVIVMLDLLAVTAYVVVAQYIKNTPDFDVFIHEGLSGDDIHLITSLNIPLGLALAISPFAIAICIGVAAATVADSEKKVDGKLAFFVSCIIFYLLDYYFLFSL